MTDLIALAKDWAGLLAALAAAAVAALVAALLPVNAGIAIPILTFLSVASFVGLVAVWLRAAAAVRTAEKAAAGVTANYVHLVNRLIRLEHQLQGPASPLRSTVAEVTGTVGALGGVVRELARSVAAQTRDVADLKDTLKPSRGRGEATVAVQPAMEEPAAAPAPTPSLLPLRPTSDEDLARRRQVEQAFESGGLELHMQPVVALPQRKIRFYEALARLRLKDGTLLGPAEFLPVFERFCRMAEFDRRMLERAMAVARHLVARGSDAIVAVNISEHSLAEPGFLWSLTGLVDMAPETLGKIVLELPQQSWRRLDADQTAALAALRERGVPMSLDRAGDLSFDAKQLADLGVRFMKLPAELMIAAANDGDGPELGVRDFASVLRREGIKLVAERVEREDMVPLLAELGVPLAQGFVFAAPRPVKAEVLEPARAEASSLRRAG